MRLLLLMAALAAFPAHADLYRWIDRQTGSVKFSNAPPPWYGDPEKERNAPAVEVIPYRAAGAHAFAALEARWAELNRFFAALPATADFSRAGGLRQQLETYVALSAELDRLDPAGAARRRAQDAGILQRLRRELE